MKRKTAEQIVNDIGDDLPDGAYFAMIEEFQGIPDHFYADPKGPEKTIPCPKCGKKFASARSLDQHGRAKHSKE